MVSRGSSHPESRSEGRFFGHRVNCERVPFLPAWAVAWVLDDPRKIPYLLVWQRPEGSAVREVVRVSLYGQFPADWAEIKRPMERTRDLIRTLLRPLPRNGGKARLLICPYCKIPRRGLYGWELGGQYTSRVIRSTWGCRKCNLLRYASEGGALVHHDRGALASLFEPLCGPRSPGSLTSSPHLKRQWEPVFCESRVDATSRSQSGVSMLVLGIALLTNRVISLQGLPDRLHSPVSENGVGRGRPTA
jgi:hypothetical protein